MKNWALSAVFCVLASQVAAQELGVPSAEAGSNTGSWDGVYVGLAVTSGDVSGPAGTTDSSTQGFGLQFGYMRDFGSLVAGGEFAYVDAEFDDTPGLEITSSRLKAIGGYDAGRFMPYAFVGLSNVEFSSDTGSLSESAPNYGLGGRVAFGAEGQMIAGLEYLVEEVSDLGGSGLDIDNSDLSLRLDYRY